MKKGIKCVGMCRASWRQLSSLLEMASMTAFGVFLITALTIFKSGTIKRNVIIRLTTFNGWIYL